MEKRTLADMMRDDVERERLSIDIDPELKRRIKIAVAQSKGKTSMRELITLWIENGLRDLQE